MLRYLKHCSIAVLLLPMLAGELRAQEEELSYNPLSLHPIPTWRILYKKSLWWRIDMREKQNTPFFSRGNELSRIIIEAVKQDLLVPYENDSVRRRMLKSTFLENLKLPEEEGGLSEEERALGFGEDDFGDWGDEDDGGAASLDPSAVAADEFDPRDISIVEIKEDWLFDKGRSRMYHDIHVITLVLPADKNPALYEKPIASFRFVDLAEIFRGMPERAIWFNTENMSKHLNMVDAFLLRLFNANLVKIANPDDDRIVDIYERSRRHAIIASQQLEEELVEFENELWEY